MEFRDKPMQNLVRIPEKDICKNAQKLLLDGETVVGAYMLHHKRALLFQFDLY